MPGTIRHHGNTVGNGDYGFDPFDTQGAGFIVGRHFAAEHRRLAYCSKAHSVSTDINAEYGTAIDL